MTAYSQATSKEGNYSITIELCSANHRYKEVCLSLPREWLALEVEVEHIIRARLTRGRIECMVRTDNSLRQQGALVLDEKRMQYAYDIYCKIARLLGMDKKPSLELVACTDGVLSTCVQSMEHVDTVRPRLVSLLNEALDKLIRAREIEGAKLHNEIIHHLDKAEKMLVEIRKCIPEEQKISNEHAKKRICNLAQNANVSEERLAQELAIIAEHSDVTEELARLTSHIKQFRKLLNENVPHGRELDFFIQEMNREVNTLCSKFHSVPVVHNAISVRAELEKIREQVQNVE